jgi:hypothetical protein
MRKQPSSRTQVPSGNKSRWNARSTSKQRRRLTEVADAGSTYYFLQNFHCIEVSEHDAIRTGPRDEIATWSTTE